MQFQLLIKLVSHIHMLEMTTETHIKLVIQYLV
jgi:hypothetical protein